MGTGLTIPPGSPATKQFFQQAQQASVRGDYRVRNVLDNTSFQFTFNVPWDFVTLISLGLICIPEAGAIGGSKNIDLGSNYGAVGQLFNIHSEVNPGFTTDFLTPDNIYEVDVSSVFSSLAAGDFCGLRITLNALGGGLDVLGVLLRYE